MKLLGTIEEVIEAVGGRSAAASLAGLNTPNGVSNWKARGRIPPELFFVFKERLLPDGKEPGRSIFGFTSADGDGVAE
jgi:hypothetical protein